MRADSPTQPFMLGEFESAMRGKVDQDVQATVRNPDDLPSAFHVFQRDHATASWCLPKASFLQKLQR